MTGRLRWLLPSSATYQAVERALPFCLRSPSFIAHTAGSGGDSALPTRHPHDGDANPHSGWLQGPWMPFPPSSECLHQVLSTPRESRGLSAEADGQRRGKSNQQVHEPSASIFVR